MSNQYVYTHKMGPSTLHSNVLSLFERFPRFFFMNTVACPESQDTTAQVKSFGTDT